MDTAKVIDKLNEILRHEWTGVAQYAQASFVIAGMWRPTYGKLFEESAEESFGHAKLVGNKITAMGGVPAVERNPIQQSNDVDQMLRHALEFETAAARLYNEALELTEGDRALTVFLEDILKEEQEGVDEFTQILATHGGADKRQSASNAG